MARKKKNNSKKVLLLLSTAFVGIMLTISAFLFLSQEKTEGMEFQNTKSDPGYSLEEEQSSIYVDPSAG